MAHNRLAFIRYYHLDKLLSDRHHYYDRKTLTEKVNERLEADGFKPVGKRSIEKDIEVLMDAPFNAEIKQTKRDGKIYLSYKKSSFSIFTTEMSDEEKDLLREVFDTIGQFKGLDNFEWLDKLKEYLSDSEQRQVISFSNNPYLRNSNLLGKLYDYISNKVVINLSYHTFSDDSIRSIVLYPYLLKQYNDRWYVLGADSKDMKILHFALDRIDKVESLPEKKYIDCDDDLSDRFEDIVGVTFYEDRPIEHILCWVSDASKSYVDTKPIHGSYTPIKGENDQHLRKEYPQLQGGMFFTLDCIRNYELIRELCSYGKDLIVLHSDGDVKNEVMKRIQEINDNYSELRTLRS